MASRRSVTIWIQRLKTGDADAAQNIWQRYAQRLLGLARKRLFAGRRRAADEDDVAQIAFVSLWRGVTAGRFSQLTDRRDLWSLLRVIATRKAANQRRHDARKKRGGGVLGGESEINTIDCECGGNGISQFADDRLAPDEILCAKEQYDQMLEALEDTTLRKIAVCKADGHTNEQVARLLNCSRSTVARKLDLIRKTWKAAGES